MKKEMGFFAGSCVRFDDFSKVVKFTKRHNVKNITISPPKLPSKPCFPCRLAFQFLV